MGSDLPERNPFPFQATTAVEEGPFVASYRPWVQTTPTLTVEPVRRLYALVRRYRESFDGWDHPEYLVGQAAFVYGPHGTGKTHAIRAAVGEAATEVEQPALLPLYVKLSSPNIASAYRRLMSQLSLGDLTDLALRFLASLAPAAGPSLTGSVEELLRDDPSALLTMFSDHVLERGLLLQAQADRLRSVVTGELDFQRALTYLLEPDLKDAAYAWLSGRTLSEQQLRQLGLSGQLDTPDQCQYGLQLLALICARAERPLVLILDQAEKFLAQPDGTAVAESIGFLHSLVEKVPEHGGLLIAAANDETWSMLPLDLRQRFGVNDIACVPLQPGQAFELLGLYILAAYGDSPPAGYRAPTPFTEPAVRKLLRNSGGNLRSLLQLAWRSFDELPPERREIDVFQVPDEVVPYDLRTAEAAVGRALWRLGPPSDDIPPGFHHAVALGNAGNLLIRVSEALFYLDEANRAADDIRAVLDAAGETGGPRRDLLVLVVIGYASPEVLHLLRPIYDDVVVYRDEESLAERLGRLVGPLDARPAGATAADYGEAYQRLAEVGWSRSVVQNNFYGEAAAVAASHDDELAAARYEELTRRWPTERERLTRRIEAVRLAREDADLDELHRVATAYYRRRWLAVTVLISAAVLTFVVLALVLPQLLLTGTAAPRLDLVSGGVVLLATIGAVAGSALARLQPSRPSSINEAHRIARQQFSRPRRALIRIALWAQRRKPRFGPDDLYSPDPYHRVGWLLIGLGRDSPSQLGEALRTERVRMIRRMLAGRLGAVLSARDLGLPADLLRDTDPTDLPYLLERYPSPYWSEVVGLPAPVRLLVSLMNGYGEGVRAGDRPVVLRRRSTDQESDPVLTAVQQLTRTMSVAVEPDPAVRQVIAAAAGTGALGAAYRKGLSLDRLLDALDSIDDHELRRARKLLSPFDGLGAGDQLTKIDEVEQLYLFVEQLLFFREGGLVVPSGRSRAISAS